ncbi:MAG: M1 family metallopeptidase [Croceibacterium sp.]
MRLAAPLLFLLAAACSSTGGAEKDEKAMISPILTTEDARDPSSYAQPEVARVTHLALDLNLDFAAKSVVGTATLDILGKPGADTVVLDDRGLVISKVTDSDGAALPYKVGPAEAEKGAPLTITMGDKRKIVITYSATNAEALQWLTPEQTAGHTQPFLFSQGEAILNRTWIPTQDSPGIRQTWDARITAPKALTVVMSGLKQGEPEDVGSDRHAFHYAMDKPVAPYLIAIAAGDIAFRELGPRTGVWAEPATLDAAAAELADTEKMVSAAEELYGPYRWGRYEMIVLPPSFPYGGMENPTLTFLTPTFIAGDKSLNGLVAHELSHSWSGNLVTNANWTDSWLNEGTTTYFENRILEKLYGPKRAQQEAALAYAGIEELLAEKGKDAPITALHLTAEAGGTPDGGESAIVYDKGALFYRTVESIVGRDKFDAWLRQWFDNHAFQPATSALLLADMRANLVKGDAELERKLMLDEWVYGTGLPSNAVKPDPTVFSDVDAAVESYKANGTVPGTAWTGWNTAERQRFLSGVPAKRSTAQLAALDSALHLSQDRNNEELFDWIELGLKNRYDPAIPLAERFLSSIGRFKFVSPLYKELMDQGSWGQPIARRLYAANRAGYHAVTQGKVDEVMKGGA